MRWVQSVGVLVGAFMVVFIFFVAVGYLTTKAPYVIGGVVTVLLIIWIRYTLFEE